MTARDRGLPTVIYRLGMITGHSENGGSQLGNLICRMIKGFIQMGHAPDLDMGMVLAPVDYVVAAIAALSDNADAIGQTFHIVSPHRLQFKQLIADINAIGHRVDLIPYDSWHRQLLNQPPDNALIPIASMFTYNHHYGGTPIETGTFVGQTHDARGALHCLESTGIQCPALTQKTIQTYIRYFSHQGFLCLPAASTITVV
jgi:thioester reductase-like protein